MKRVIRPDDIRPDPRREVGDEIRFHLEMREREFMDQGMSPDEARRAARTSFGDVSAIASELASERAGRNRERTRRDWRRGTALDVRHALRALRKRPVFASAAILTLALGTGATVAIYTVVNGVLVRPLPYAAPDRLAMIWMRGNGVRANERWPLSSGFYLDLSAATRSFASTAAFRSWPQTLRDGDVAERMQGARVTPSLFRTLGTRAQLGRLFDDGDTTSGAAPVALISHNLWQRRFGGAASVIGRMVTLNGVRTSIVGVVPRGFNFPRGAELPSGLQFGQRTDVWIPLRFSAQDAQNYGTQNLAAVARLRDGATFVLAQRDLEQVVSEILKRLGAPIRIGMQVVSLHDQATQPVQRGLLIVMAGVILVFLIACVNVTNLLIARTAERGRELAVRTALGARRSRVARQLLTENLVLAFAGAALGVLFAVWGVRALLALVPGSLPRADDVAVDWRVAAVAVGLAMGCGVLLGLVSTMAYARTNLMTALHGSSQRTSSGPRARLGRRALVTVEVALSMVLLVSAGLLVQSFVTLQRVDPGFDPRDAVTADVSVAISDRFNPAADGPGWMRFFEQLTTRLSALPGTRAAGAVSALPLTGTVEGSGFTIVGEPPPLPGQRPTTQYSVVDGDYFRAAGIALRRGRYFDARDRTTGPGVVIVSEALARRYFPNANAIGRQIVCSCEFFRQGPREIIGVVADVKMGALSATDVPGLYVPESQMPYPFLSVVVRSGQPAEAVISAIRREVKALDPSVSVGEPRTLAGVFSDSLASQRFSLVLIGAFAGSALLLSLLGLYGIVTLGVEHRRRELGVRMALGARPGDVRQLVLREGMAMTSVGLAIGLVLAYNATGVLKDLLFGVDPRSAVIFGLCGVIVAVTALGASYLPARRATQVEPSATLRSD